MSNNLKQKPCIGFAGMSHLGLNSATATAKKGFPVIGFDPSNTLISELKQRKTSINEPQLDDLLSDKNLKLDFTSHLTELQQCDIIYISIDVRTNDNNQSDLSAINQLIEAVSQILSQDSLLVILSQVPPGFCRQINIHSTQLYYQVETLIFGQAIDRALNPERFIIGTADPSLPLPEVFQALLHSFNCDIFPMRYESAELAKLSINLYLASSITTSNILAEICTKIGADWNEIVPTLKQDRRIGPFAYLQPGLGIAGGNIERDLAGIINIGTTHNAEVQVIRDWFKNSSYQKNWVYRCLQQHIFPQLKQPKIAILGLAYKPNTHSLKNAPSVNLLHQLKSHQIKAHDPVVTEKIITNMQLCSTYQLAIQDADVVIILTPWPEYNAIDLNWLKQSMQSNWVIDPFHVLNHTHCLQKGFEIFTLGAELSTKQYTPVKDAEHA